MFTRKIATLSGVGIAGLALISAGAMATFTQTTQSYQQVTAGTMNVTLSGEGVLSDSAHTLTFANFGPTGSTFTTGDKLVTITNSGDISVNEITSQIGVSGDADLISQLYVCETSSGTVIRNGPLSAALGVQAIVGTLAPTSTDAYTINVYAGNATTACGAVTAVGAPAVSGTSTAPSLPNAAQGLNATVSVTVGYSG